MGFIEENNKERLAFIDLWAEYVKTHPDREWSHQQNMIINSMKSNMTKEEFLKMKG
jgi:hypothetical protein